ncbi:pyruvate formate lyase-activating protein [bacterium]|nr:pyruvate formate lyase-activating protein [bacterium]
MKKIYGNIHSIESFGTVDGPGVRLVVFMQGCPMRCQYCHNPDTWEYRENTQITADDILKKYDSIKEFLKNGGITVTGGEPLSQIEFVTELFKKAKEKNIHTALDTSGILFNKENTEKIDILLKYTDLVMLDIKHINDEEHKRLTKHSNKNILDFANYLSEKQIPIWIRHVVVPTITDNEKDLKELGKFIANLKTLKALDILPYHNMAIPKYENLGIDYPLKDLPPLTKQQALNARTIIFNSFNEERKKK